VPGVEPMAATASTRYDIYFSIETCGKIGFCQMS